MTDYDGPGCKVGPDPARGAAPVEQKGAPESIPGCGCDWETICVRHLQEEGFLL